MKSEWEEFKNASPEVKKEGLRIFTAAQFRFKIHEAHHPQAMDIHYVCRGITWEQLKGKLNEST